MQILIISIPYFVSKVRRPFLLVSSNESITSGASSRNILVSHILNVLGTFSTGISALNDNIWDPKANSEFVSSTLQRYFLWTEQNTLWQKWKKHLNCKFLNSLGNAFCIAFAESIVTLEGARNASNFSIKAGDHFPHIFWAVTQTPTALRFFSYAMTKMPLVRQQWSYLECKIANYWLLCESKWMLRLVVKISLRLSLWPESCINNVSPWRGFVYILLEKSIHCKPSVRLELPYSVGLWNVLAFKTGNILATATSLQPSKARDIIDYWFLPSAVFFRTVSIASTSAASIIRLCSFKRLVISSSNVVTWAENLYLWHLLDLLQTLTTFSLFS